MSYAPSRQRTARRQIAFNAASINPIHHQFYCFRAAAQIDPDRLMEADAFPVGRQVVHGNGHVKKPAAWFYFEGCQFDTTDALRIPGRCEREIVVFTNPGLRL